MKKVVFITGISSGFGKEISKQLAERGHKVYGTIRTKCEVAPGVNTVFIELTDPQSIQKAVASVIEKEGRIDVLINNAGMHSGGPIEETPMEVIRAQMETNYFGWISVIKNIVPIMREQRGGTIINISSIGGLTGLPFQGVYSAAKFALEGMSAALRLELRPFNINVVMVNPGDFKTRNTETRIVSIAENSVYQQQFEKTLGIIAKDETQGKDPELLGRTICKIVEARKPRDRYLVGAFIQKLAVFVKHITSDRWFSWIIGKYYGIK
ncbi:SDR family oxidoreductase [Roseimarinus sediminis]|uniref:SDR family oxidoreductase n=1 Tax=Roseimarinus sediminis TaxID=1610899 RepID=UPI003D1DB8E8